MWIYRRVQPGVFPPTERSVFLNNPNLPLGVPLPIGWVAGLCGAGPLSARQTIRDSHQNKTSGYLILVGDRNCRHLSCDCAYRHREP